METIHNFEAIKTFPVISDDCAIYQKRGIVGHICRVQTLTSHISLRHIDCVHCIPNTRDGTNMHNLSHVFRYF